MQTKNMNHRSVAHWLKYRQRSLATVGKENGNGWRAQTEPIAPRQPAQAQESVSLRRTIF
jgi:hypothetical protein